MAGGGQMGLTVGTNSYVELGYADEYFRARDIDGTGIWKDLTKEQKEAILVQAASLLDTLIYKGAKKDPNQPMAFPRVLMIKHGVEFAAELLDTGSIYEAIAQLYPQEPYIYRVGDIEYIDIGTPEIIKMAQCEQAKYLLEMANDPRIQAIMSGVSSVAVGSVRETYNTDRVNAKTVIISPMAKSLIKPLIAGAVGQI